MIWVNPTSLNHVTSPFDLKRKHPVYGYVMPHTGTDYRAPTGTLILAAADGVVTRSVLDDRAGNYMRVDHGGGIWTGYSHLSRRDVVVGQRVTAGQRVGLSGATGAVTAAHLHFEVCVDGVKVDPVPFLAAHVGPATVSAPVTTTPTAPEPIPVPAAPVPLTPTSEEDDMKDYVIALYVLLLGRMPDATGLASAVYDLTRGRRSLEQVELDIRGSQEFLDLEANPQRRVDLRNALHAW